MNSKLAHTKEILKNLIQFDTTSCYSNIPAIDYIEDYLKQYGLSPTRIPNLQGDKQCLYVTIGAQRAGGICLSGHTDVVPVEGQDWHSNPFEMIEKDGKLFGRGTCDMKGYLACCLALVPDLVQAQLDMPIHMIFSYDEEIGCEGVLPTIERFGDDLFKPNIVVVGEPSMMQVANAHKSLNTFKTTISGLEGHSSNPEAGVNAIYIASEMINYLREMAEKWQERKDETGLFTPDYTTIHVGVIEGGTEHNIIPNHCSFQWEYRGLPSESDTEILDRVNAFAADVLIPKYGKRNDHESVKIETISVSRVPALKPETNGQAEVLVKRAAQVNHAIAVSYATEAGQFQKNDISTIICGPGSIDQAHKANEFVEISQLSACIDFLDRLMLHEN